MTAERDLDTWLVAWMADAAGEPPTRRRVDDVAVEIRRRRPRVRWMARVHDRWAHGTAPSEGDRARVGLLAIAAVTLLALAGLAGQFVPGGSPEPNGRGPAFPSPTATATSRRAATPSVTAAPGVRVSPSPAAIGTLCRPDAPATLPVGPLPETARPSDLPTNDGRLAVWDPVALAAVDGAPALLDVSTGRKDVVTITSDGKHVEGNTFIIPGWSPDGRWLALRRDQGDLSCGGELIVSADGTQAIDVTDYPTGRGVLDGAWSPDAHWLAVNGGDRIDVFEISPDGSIGDARTVWKSPKKDVIAFGPAWGPDGTLAFQLEGQDSGATVALLSSGATEPQLVQVPPDVLAPLAWTTDGTAIIARGDVGMSDVGMFRITAQRATRIPLPGLHLHGGKWLDVPEAVVGDRIVFAAYTDVAAPDVESIYSVMPDGSGLIRLTDRDFPVSTGVTFAPAADGHRVAVSTGGIWILDLADGSKRESASADGGIMDWQPVP